MARRWYAFDGCISVTEAILSGARILIVEDDPLSGRTLAAILCQCGYSAELVMSVTAGLERLCTMPDCVLVDLTLPDGDGALILARVHASRAQIHIAVVTGVVDEQRLESMLRLGADRVFAKPVDVEDLLDWIEQVTANPSDQSVRPPDDLPGFHLR